MGQQVLTADGKPYDDDPESPVVVLGDSFTGVYQLTDCEHAGLSAHLARALGHPVDLVMSYGGGPNVRHKLMRRGAADIGRQAAGHLGDDRPRSLQLLGGLGAAERRGGWRPPGQTVTS